MLARLFYERFSFTFTPNPCSSAATSLPLAQTRPASSLPRKRG